MGVKVSVRLKSLTGGNNMSPPHTVSLRMQPCHHAAQHTPASLQSPDQSSIASVAAEGLGDSGRHVICLRLLLEVGDGLGVVLGGALRHRHRAHHVLGLVVVVVAVLILVDGLGDVAELRLVCRLRRGDDVAGLVHRLGHLCAARRGA